MYRHILAALQEVALVKLTTAITLTASASSHLWRTRDVIGIVVIATLRYIRPLLHVGWFPALTLLHVSSARSAMVREVNCTQ
ncbi:hypothetical protein C8Q77DRAFT_1087629 [Trametes polyzona]|nr:hypothetical protein C8Q77DRAFT_1087629 [Trametes polyzona]